MNRAPPRIFDRRRSAAKWARARARQASGGAAYLAETMAEDVLERLDFMRFDPSRALIIGDVSHTLHTELSERGVQGSIGFLGDFDEEQPGPAERFDLIVHLLGLGIVNDLPGALIHARNALTEGGLFIAAFPGAGSLCALREIALTADRDRPAARIHPQVDNRAGTALLERAGFRRQVVDSYPIRVRFSSLERMIADLRDHGLTSSLADPGPALTHDWLTRARGQFDAMRDDEGKITETFEVLTLTGWR